MSTEIPVETGIADLPDTNIPEAPENNELESNQEVIPEVGQEQAGPSEIEVYQDIIAKHEEDSSYEMSDEECEIYDVVQEKIATKQIDTPQAKKIEAKKSETEGTQDTENTEEATNGEETPAEESADVTPEFKLSDDQSSNLQTAMSKVGAKDLSELPDKIDGLLKTMKTSGGQLGTQLKEVQQREANHMKWMEDLKAGKPEAIEYLHQVTGKSVPTGSSESSHSANNTNTGTNEFDPSKFLDEELAATVQGIMDQNKKLTASVEKLSNGDQVRQEQFQREETVNSWIDDIVDVATSKDSDFGITASEARALAKDYWSEEGAGKAIHPKFQKAHELMVFAKNRGCNNLNDAHILWQHENGGFAQKIVDARKKGEKATNYEESVNLPLSSKQSRTKSNGQDPHIDDSAVQKMSSGESMSDIPDSWTDQDGNLMPDKVPKRFHVQAFGRVMG